MNTNKQQIDSFHYLRILCTFLIVLLHSTNYYCCTPCNLPEKFIFSIWHTLTAASLPCFAFMSGALILNKEKKQTLPNFYKHIFTKFSAPILIYLIFYFFIELPHFIHNVLESKISIINAIKGIATISLKGPGVAWWLYMTIGLYLMTPAIRKFFIPCSLKIKFTIGIIITAASIIYTILQQNSLYYFEWNSFLISFLFLGYYLLGHCLMESKLKNSIWLSTIHVTMLSFVIIAFTLFPTTGTALTPYAFTSGIIIFSFFLHLPTKANSFVRKLSTFCYIIYLFHPFVIRFVYSHLIKVPRYSDNFNSLSSITQLGITILVFIICMFVAFLMHPVFHKTEKLIKSFIKA